MKVLEPLNISPIICLWEFSRRSMAADPILWKFKPIQDFKDVLIICKNE